MTDWSPAGFVSCDDVFDALTRAPFPSGDHKFDETVRHHLACCHDCRQLAEALRPATSALGDTLPEEEAEYSLPRFSDDIPAPQDIRRKDHGGRLAPLGWPGWLGLSLAVCLLVAVRVGTMDSVSSALAPPAESASSDWPGLSTSGAMSWTSLCSLSPAEILAESEESDLPVHLAARNSEQIRSSSSYCCSRCHHSDPDDLDGVHQPGQRQWQQSQMLAIVRSCGKCH